MIRYLLDTNIVSDLINNPRGTVRRKIQEVGEGAVCTSIIAAAELRFGVAKKGSARLAERVEDALNSLEVLPFDAPADLAYGELRAQLEAAGTPISGNDTLIAAHALALGLVVVTDNQREFARVDGLSVENWLCP